jgi:hypothetical protein
MATAAEENLFGLPVLEQRGAHACRPSRDNPWLSAGMEDDGEETAPRLIVPTVHIAPWA